MAALLGEKNVGDIIKFKVDGIERNFIVAAKPPFGLAQNIGVILQDIWTEVSIGQFQDNGYNAPDSYFYDKIEPGVRSQIIPLTDTANNLQDNEKVFLLFDTQAYSQYSVGWPYFNGDSARIAHYNGRAENWHLHYKDGLFYYVTSYGEVKHTTYPSNTYGYRPAMVLPSSLPVSEDGTVVTNQPPEPPASITVPENIQGGSSITISWAASSDPDGNLEGYILERSTDGGSGWQQVYQGAATSTTNTVAFGTESVIYRVKAYDAAGAESGWRTSAQVTVTNNNAPAAPGSITVPNLVKGGEPLAVSWAAASDPDGNLTGYELERKTDAADWAQVYKGDALSYTDQITKGWQTVQYRVRALDSYNAASGWTESETRTVDNNSAPVITCEHPSGSDLGEKAEPFALNYTVTDPDGDPLTVTETLDDTPTRSEEEVESGAALTAATLNDPAEFQKILNGTHSLKISASDGKAIAAHNLTFTKKVTSASVTLKTPMAVEGDISLAVLRVAGSIPADALFTVEVTNNGNDDEPVWQDATDEVKRGANIVFENHTAAKGAAFNFRLSVSRGPSGEGGYLTSISGAFQ